MQRHTPRTRNAALRRLRAANRWLIAGSTALTGALAAVAANAFPGHTVKHKAGNASTRTRNGKATSGRGASGASPQLKPPASAPEAGSESGAAPGGESGSESSSGAAPEESTAPGEEAPPVEEAPPAEETPPAEAPTAPEAEGPAETQTGPEAPVVSGGS